MDTLFSRREKLQSEIAEITIIDEAPYELRNYLSLLINNMGLGLKEIRKIICLVVQEAENPNNWGENDYMREEVRLLIENCEWYHVYDVIEAIYKKLSPEKKQIFADEINRYFEKSGIGWKLEGGKILSRGNSQTEFLLRSAYQNLEAKNQKTSTNELKEAINDFSRRPEPDLTGVVQHSNAALECVAREYTQDPNKTLGKIISENPDIFPKPLGEAVFKMWGYASNYGRHVHEGNPPSREEAELMLYISASLCSYLSKKL